MLPIVIIIFSKILGMKAGDCFKAGLHIGIGFVGIGLVIGLMLDSIGPAAKAMAENFDLNLHVGRCWLAGLFTNDLGVANCAGGDSDCDSG
ncbi:PTS system, galactitol-specific IIC component protein [Escherichia coli]|nr:PTS system, galactitol-specific IIC component protein [Escherichia coli]